MRIYNLMLMSTTSISADYHFRRHFLMDLAVLLERVKESCPR
jgi:hypothetical protein